MDDSPPAQDPPAPAPQRRPLVTGTLVGLAAASFLASMILKPDDWAGWNRLGRFSAEQLWDGAWWAYLTTIFPHGGLLHVGFNCYWVWILGGLIERSRPRWLVVIIALLGAVVGSGLELLIGGSLGIGLSGVVYACFGYLLGQQFSNNGYRIPARFTQIMIGWLLLCFPLTWFGLLNIANYAHLGGLLAGLALGAIWPRPRRRPWARPVGALLTLALLAAAILPAIHHPFSSRYDFHRGNTAFGAEDYRAAIDWYERALARDPTFDEARFNRDLARYRLGEGPPPSELPDPSGVP